MNDTTPTPTSLVARARAQLDRAHAPYSGLHVSAVVVDEHGAVHGGVNVENASYGLTVCAERVAIFTAVAAGARRITALALTSDRIRPITPCGACRQVMSEFMAPDAPVHADAGDDRVITWTMGALLPAGFDAATLAAAVPGA